MNIVKEIYKCSINNPHDVAIVCEGRSYTYSEMVGIIEGLSAMLAEKFICKHDFVGVLTTRSELSVFLYLAILKIGAVYIPIDESLPHKRIEKICKDAKIKLLIGDNTVCDYDKKHSYDVINISNSHLQRFKNLNSLAHTVDLENDDPSVILFTSGSTGTPKGVILPHESLYICSQIEADRNTITPKDRILTVLNFCFAFSLQYLQPLIKGATLYIGTDSIRSNFFTLREYIKSNNITIITMPTQMGHIFCEDSVPPSIRLVIVGGSALPPTRTENHYNLVSIYGCSECLNAAYHIVGDCSQEYMIGKPNVFMNFSIDKDDSENDISGELLLSGPMVALGYLNSPEIEKKKFIYKKGERWYKTGDKVKLMPNGEYKYICRLDNMVKICDHRIELEEIEHAILANNDIKQVCICIKDIMGKRSICAYYVSREDITINLHQYLNSILPDYMIPSYFIKVQTIPVNSSGKFDCSKLPIPITQKKDFVSPRNEKEKTLIECVSKIIPNITKIGVYDNYKDIGGDSLDALRIITELREKGHDVSLYDILNSKNFAELSTHISQVKVSKTYECDKKQDFQFDISCNLLYLKLLNTVSVLNRFIIPEFYCCKRRVTYSIVKETAEILVSKHEMLRATISPTYFTIDVNNTHPHFSANEVYLDIDVKTTPYKLEGHIEQLYSEINISKGLLYALTLIHAKDSDYILTAYSHLVTDNFSKIIIAQDFMTIISCLIRNVSVQLPAISNKYRLYCISIYKRFLSKKTKCYLPYKYIDAQYDTLHITMKKEFCTYFDSIIKEHKIDVESFFSYIITKCLSTVTGETLNNFLLYMHGRDLCKSSLTFDRTVGFFVSYCIVNFEYDENLDLFNNIINLKRRIYEAKKNNVLISELYNLPKVGINYLGEIKYNIGKVKDIIDLAPYIPKYTYTPDNLNMYTPITTFIIKQENSVVLQIRYNSYFYSSRIIANILDKIRQDCSEIMR